MIDKKFVSKALWLTRPKFAIGGLTDEEKALLKKQLTDFSEEKLPSVDPNNPASSAISSAQSQTQDQPQSQPTQTGSNFFSDKLSDIAANSGRTAVNAAFGLVPIAGPINTISGFFNGPTVGGALMGNKGTQAPSSTWDKTSPIDLNTYPASKSQEPQAAVNPADLPAPGVSEAGNKGLPPDIVQAIVAAQAAQQKSVPAPWANAVVSSETGGTFNPDLQAKGSSAKGLFQVLTSQASPWTQFQGKGSPFNPQENARVGTSLMQYNVELLQKNNLPVTPQNIYALQGMGPAGIKVLQNPDKPVSQTLSNYNQAVKSNSYMAGKTGQQLADFYGSKLSKNTPNFDPNQTLEDWEAIQKRQIMPIIEPDKESTRDQGDPRQAQEPGTPAGMSGGDQIGDGTGTGMSGEQGGGGAPAVGEPGSASTSSGPDSAGDTAGPSSESASGGSGPSSGETFGGVDFGMTGTPGESAATGTVGASPSAPEAPSSPGDFPGPGASPMSSTSVPGDIKSAMDRYFADKSQQEEENQDQQGQDQQNQESATEQATDERPSVSNEEDDDDDDGDDGDDGGDAGDGGDGGDGGDDGDGDGDGDGGDGGGDGGGGDGGGGEKRGGRIIRKNKRQRPKKFNVRHAALEHDSAALRRALALALKASKRGK